MRSKPPIFAWAGALLLATSLCSCGDDAVAPPPDEPPPSGDHTPPETVSDLALAFDPATGDARLSWTAPRDDAQHDRVAGYQIRLGYSFPMDWWTTPEASNPPAPLAAGAPQEYAIADPTRGRDLYAAMRCVDAAGHLSPMSSVAHARVPGYSFQAVCVDAMTRVPVAGLDVRIDERYPHDFVTGVDGTVALFDLLGNPSIRVGAARPPPTTSASMRSSCSTPIVPSPIR